jgi:iron complex transport system ATP-binding protein
MILDVQGISFSYNSHPVLEDIHFKLHPGELLAILGPNGVGKTTLLKCLNTILSPACGAIWVEERDVLKLSQEEIARSIGYVAQHSQVCRMTVFDTVLMGRKPHIRWKVRDKDLKIVEAAIRRLDLNHLSLRHVDQLSGGELQKVAIARALVQDPTLMLLDEPTSSLDLKGQVDILFFLQRVVRQHQIGAVMTMHDLNTALRFADRCIFLKEGQIHCARKVSEVRASDIEDVYGLEVSIHNIDGYPTVIPQMASTEN